jgi:hypothetical protein
VLRDDALVGAVAMVGSAGLAFTLLAGIRGQLLTRDKMGINVIRSQELTPEAFPSRGVF